jgi:hypothetical protein
LSCVRDKFLDCDYAFGRQCAPDFFQKTATAVTTLAVQNVAERRHLVPAAKIASENDERKKAHQGERASFWFMLP